jgi:hypothetical protein
MKEIMLTQGKVAIVDDEDYEYLCQWKWLFIKQGYAARNAHLGYINGKQKQRLVFMHRQILNAPEEMHVDHINGDGLNNSRLNIRLCTKAQNRMNRKPQLGTSKYKGVCWDKANSKWLASIAVNGKSKTIGRFLCEIEAAAAYNECAKDFHGEFARLNNLQEVYH